MDIELANWIKWANFSNKLPKLTQHEVDHLNGFITLKEI